jgi:hypothetical protein
MALKALNNSELENYGLDTFAKKGVRFQTLLRCSNGQLCDVFHKVRTSLRPLISKSSKGQKNLDFNLNSKICLVYSLLGACFCLVRTLLRPVLRFLKALYGSKVWTLLRMVTTLIFTDFPFSPTTFLGSQDQVRTLLRGGFGGFSSLRQR